MTRAAVIRAYMLPAVIFNFAIVLIIVQALGGSATRAERITWLAVAAFAALILAWQVNAALAWKSLYRSAMASYDSLQESYDKCAASRDYWMGQVQTGAAALTGQPPPGQRCRRCGQPPVSAKGDCQHDVCGWCAWCPSCSGPYALGPRPQVIP